MTRESELLAKDEIIEVFRYLEEVFGIEVETELDYYNHYQLVVAIMLSAQMTDKGVNRVSGKLFSLIKSPEDALNIGIDGINDIIKSVNYHNVKSEHIFEMSKQLVERYNSTVPNNFEDLMALKGVGRKTANLVLSIAFQQNRIAVDTHCFRVANRLGIVKAKNTFEAEQQLSNNVPKQKHREINSLLISLGRRYCRAINPKCEQCGLKKLCKFYNNNKRKSEI